jgi:hypothetical protein
MTSELDDLDEEINDDLETVIRKAAVIATPVFERQGWTWAFVDASPTEDEIFETFRWLAEHILEDPASTYCSTGRLTVRRSEDDSDDLEFSVEVGNWWAE